ncbi:MAG: dioxygenase, partial [Bdellovibrionaceae bacterium]|nr:dioxygenase [Pseudobdellovibrionaceae bacterium]
MLKNLFMVYICPEIMGHMVLFSPVLSPALYAYVLMYSLHAFYHLFYQTNVNHTKSPEDFTKIKMPVYFISHGGGPWPWLQGPYREAYQQLESSLKKLPYELPEKPKAILMISGHWEENNFSIMTHPKPPMLYDYGGFPQHTYHIKYPAVNSAELISRVQTLLNAMGIYPDLDPNRGFDHGTFTPLAVSYPDADIPVVQLSLRADYDPETH